MQVYLRALGCRLNEAELEAWGRTFQDKGHNLAGTLEQADVVVVNTCAVTQEAARKSRQLIRRAQRGNPKAKLVISGCLASLEPDRVSAMDGVDLLVHNQEKDQLVEIAARALDLQAMPALATAPGEMALFARGRHRAFVKIQDGCRYRCTFCIVTVARGEERSRPIADIVQEINRLVAQGVKEAVLTGVHLGGYGSDIASNLSELISAILADTDLPRLRLGSVEPWDLPRGFFALFRNPRLMPHLHLPLQSGSDAVLRRMARRCKSGDFERLIDTARHEIADFNITTDIIVGFPGESECEWRDSLAFIERVGFGHVHIFPYSKRAGTKASEMVEQVSPEVKKRRCGELHALALQMKKQVMAQHVGCVVPVLWEGGSSGATNERQIYGGYTPNFLRVETTAITPLDNQIRPARLGAVSDDGERIAAMLV